MGVSASLDAVLTRCHWNECKTAHSCGGTLSSGSQQLRVLCSAWRGFSTTGWDDNTAQICSCRVISSSPLLHTWGMTSPAEAPQPFPRTQIKPEEQNLLCAGRRGGSFFLSVHEGEGVQEHELQQCRQSRGGCKTPTRAKWGGWGSIIYLFCFVSPVGLTAKQEKATSLIDEVKTLPTWFQTLCWSYMLQASAVRDRAA